MCVYDVTPYMNLPQYTGVDGVGPTARFGTVAVVGRTEVSRP
jgi:hypothetical protein